MALTRAQLLAGNSSQGTVLAGQVQGVTAGSGISISASGVLSINAADPTFNGFIKTNNTSAYNAFVWPNADGLAGQQLTTNGAGTLAWSDADGIAWTAKGELVVGTGANTQTILSVGTNGQILIADSATASGLNYTSNYVATLGATSAAIMPAGSTAVRPAGPAAGYFRFNTSTSLMEFWNGAAWSTVASSISGGFVPQTSAVGSAVLPSGTTAQRDGAPVAGYFRYNTSNSKTEFWNGVAWETVSSSISGAFVSQSVPTAGTASVIIPTGTTAQRQTAPAPAGGYLRYNTDSSTTEFFNGTSWQTLASTSGGTFVGQTVPSAGTASAIIPVGTTAQRQTTPAPTSGYQRFNTDTSLMEVYNGTSWVSVGSPTAAGLGLVLDGSALKVSIPVAATPPAAGALPAQAVDGSLYWDDTLTQLFIRYNNGGSPVWVAASPSASVTAATLAQAAAGVANSVFSSPQTAVPKDASGMTGAAIIPSGTTAQIPATPTAGYLRNNTTTTSWFGHDGAGWVPFDQRRPRVTATSLTAAAGDYVVVTAATQTITLPATPIAGTVVDVIVAGTFLDTIVARNGSNIMGLAENITLDKEYAAMQFTYTGNATQGWRLN